MFTIAFLMCFAGDPECSSVARQNQVYRTEEACREDALQTIDNLENKAKEEGITALFLYKCLNWGAPA